MAYDSKKVVLIGRVNVGKSTLFNRFLEKPLALVSSEPGTTRDRREAEVSWNKSRFTIVDTGGVEAPGKKQRADAPGFESEITEQTKRGLASADLVLLMVSAQDGLMPQDQAWADELRGKVPTLVVVNKVDSEKREQVVAEFYQLGLGEPLLVSALNGRRSGDLLDVIIRRLKRTPKKEKSKSGATKGSRKAMKPTRVAIVGQPNSGKSSLLNAILGEPRVVVSPTPHTTREPIDTFFEYKEKPLVLIDTAGIRRKAHVTEGVEAQGVGASLHTIERADVIMLVIDVTRAPTLQDQRLARFIADRGKPLVIVVNKWDLVEDKTSKTMNEATTTIHALMPGLAWAPVVFTSAKTGQRVTQILDTGMAAIASADLTLDEETLKTFLKQVVKQHRPTKKGGVRHPVIVSFQQTGTRPPEFEVVTLGELHPSYVKFLENRLRDHFGFVGTPIRIELKTKRKKPHQT